MIDPHTQALKNQVVALTRDCYYLISLLNSTENIDWEGWPEGAEILKHLEQSESLLSRRMVRSGNIVTFPLDRRAPNMT